jgi:hypothetical protein
MVPTVMAFLAQREKEVVVILPRFASVQVGLVMYVQELVARATHTTLKIITLHDL